MIPDSPAIAAVSQIEDLQLQAGLGATGKDGATFRFIRNGEAVFTFVAKDLLSPWIWTTIDPGSERLALTYSDGGGIGGFHVRVFQLKDGKIIDISDAIESAVADFRKRHYCQTRGNNVEALKWIKGDLLLMTDVYPTGDCGPDLGHTEAYRVSVPTGQIQEHLTLQELKSYPGVCLQNDLGR